MRERRDAAELAMRVMGITFTVYSEEGGIDRVWPFDVIPRIISAREWRRTEQGLKQRVTVLNMFIADIYGQQQIIKDGVFPAEVLARSTNYRKQCMGIKPAYGIWAHILQLMFIDINAELTSTYFEGREVSEHLYPVDSFQRATA